MVRSLLVAGCFACGAWAIAIGKGPEVRYGLLVWGALSLWSGMLVSWIGVRRALREREGPYRKRLMRILDLGVALAPGVILIMYGVFAPAAPSLTQGGFDVCDTSPGFCVSGTRAFIHFGVFTLVVGVIAHWVVGLEPPDRRQ